MIPLPCSGMINITFQDKCTPSCLYQHLKIPSLLISETLCSTLLLPILSMISCISFQGAILTMISILFQVYKASRPTLQLRVYFIIYSGSVEEQVSTRLCIFMFVFSYHELDPSIQPRSRFAAHSNTIQKQLYRSWNGVCLKLVWCVVSLYLKLT